MSDLLIYNTEDGKAKVALFATEGDVWLTQNQLAEFFDTSAQNIGLHIKNILQDKELDENSVIKNFFITATDGKKFTDKQYELFSQKRREQLTNQANNEDLILIEQLNQKVKNKK